MKIARIYLRVSTDEQSLERQESIVKNAIGAGYYIAGTYREKASGARADRPELLRMINDIQEGDVIIAEKIDRITRLPLPEAEKLIDSIKSKGAKLVIPGIVDFSDLIAETSGMTKIVLECLQSMLLKIALQLTREDYEERRRRQFEGQALAKLQGKYKGRKKDVLTHERIVTLRKAGTTISQTAKLCGCSTRHVKSVWASYKATVTSDESTKTV